MVTKEDWTALRTGVVCVGIFYLCYFAAFLMDMYIQDARDFSGQSAGMGAGERTVGRKPIKLGPHSYQTLILSLGSLIVILGIIWLIKVTPFERLFKISPIYKLVQLFVNGVAVDREEETLRPPEDISAREQILNTCVELERRISRLEETLTPLSKSLEILSQQVLSQRKIPTLNLQPQETQEAEMARFESNSSQETTDHTAVLEKAKSLSDFEVTNRRHTSLSLADAN